MRLLLKTLTEPLDKPVSPMVKYLVKLTNKDIHCKPVFNRLVPGVHTLKKPEFVNQNLPFILFEKSYCCSSLITIHI